MNQLLLLVLQSLLPVYWQTASPAGLEFPCFWLLSDLVWHLDQRDFLEFLLIISDLLQISAQLLLFLLCFTADSEHDGKLPAQSPEKRFFSPLWERYSLLS